MKLTIYRLLTLFLLLSFTQAMAEIKGRADLGAVYAEVDILESGKTIETLHMKGAKFDSTIVLYQGYTVKASALWCEEHGGLTSGTLAVGYMVPIGQRWKFLPNVGMNWSYLHTTVEFKDFGLQLGRTHFKERFRSDTPFIGLDIGFAITDDLTLIAMYQYGWARTHTKIRTIASQKSHSCGPNYALALDYSIAEHWSLSLAGSYNITLSKEKHGLRGKGLKLGVAYYF